MRNYYRFLIIIPAVLFFLISCSGSSKKEPLADVDEVFSIGVEEAESGTYLTIPKASLGGEYLMQGSLTQQQWYGYQITNPTSESLQSRIVVFQENGDELLLMHAAEGYQPGQELPVNFLITKFPVIRQDEEIIVFDFNEGMTDVALNWDWYVSDYYGTKIYPDYTVPIQSSYLREVRIYPTAISIAQNVSIKDINYLIPLEITYYFTSYQQNVNYVPVEFPDHNYLGYFEANPLVKEGFGTPYTHITRWDISKPVVYYLSQDIPVEYRDAVKEGVLYWNKVFGQEVLKAEMAPEGITAPNFEHNVIQWHTDHYGGAYADAQMDPRTGEILHAQIFISSSFTAWTSAYDLPRLEREISNEELSGEEETAKSEREPGDGTFITAREFHDSRLCHIRFDDFIKSHYKYRGDIQALPPERKEQLTNDYLRMIVAHEVGHTLGLRHNFAASAVNELKGKEEEKILREYLKSGTLPENLPVLANSVMDYADLPQGILIGAQLVKSEEALPYDKYAVQWGYFNADSDPMYEGHSFCTDSHVGAYLDCMVWDAGKNLLERKAYETSNYLKDMPRIAAEYYLKAKTYYNPEFRGPVTESTPDAWYLAALVAGRWDEVVSILKGRARLRSIYLEYPDRADIDEVKIKGEELAWLNGQISYAGGVEEVLSLINPDKFSNIAKNYISEFEKIISSIEYQSASLPEGGNVQFAEEEIKYIKDRAKELFPEVEEQLVLNITSSIMGLSGISFGFQSPGGRGNFVAIDEIEKIEPILAKWAEYIIITGGELSFRYSVNARQEAASLLKSSGPYSDWLDAYVSPVAEKLKVKLEEIFGKPIYDINEDDYPRDQREKISAELNIYYTLASGGYYPVSDDPVVSVDSDENEAK